MSSTSRGWSGTGWRPAAEESEGDRTRPTIRAPPRKNRGAEAASDPHGDKEMTPLRSCSDDPCNADPSHSFRSRRFRRVETQDHVVQLVVRREARHVAAAEQGLSTLLAACGLENERAGEAPRVEDLDRSCAAAAAAVVDSSSSSADTSTSRPYTGTESSGRSDCADDQRAWRCARAASAGAPTGRRPTSRGSASAAPPARGARSTCRSPPASSFKRAAHALSPARPPPAPSRP